MPGSRSRVVMAGGRCARAAQYAREYSAAARARGAARGSARGESRATVVRRHRAHHPPRTHAAARSPCALARCRASPLAALRARAACGDDGAPRAHASRSPSAGCPSSPIAAQCGELEVPENRAQAGRPQDQASPSRCCPPTRSRRSPIRCSSSPAAPARRRRRSAPFAAQLTDVRRTRDIVLVDQRGTGRSSPLDCAAFKPTTSPTTALEIDPVPQARRRASQELAAQRRRRRAVHDRRVGRRPRGGARRARLRRGGTCGAAATARASRRNTCAAIRRACAAWCSTASRRRRMTISLDVWRDARGRARRRCSTPAPRRAACRAAHPTSPRRSTRIARASRARRAATSTLTDPRTGEAATPRAHVRPRRWPRCSRSSTLPELAEPAARR